MLTTCNSFFAIRSNDFDSLTPTVYGRANEIKIDFYLICLLHVDIPFSLQNGFKIFYILSEVQVQVSCWKYPKGYATAAVRYLY